MATFTARRPAGSPVPPTARFGMATTVTAFVRQHPVLAYYALTFAVSWGGVFLVVGPGGLPATPEQRMPIGLTMLAGPSVAGLLLTGFVDARAGYRALRSRLLKWRVGVRWFAVALLSAPLLTAAVRLALSLRSPEFLPAVAMMDDLAARLVPAFAGGLLVGVCEEIGWTGFAIPRLRRRYGLLGTGLVLGIVWGAWHFLMFWERDSLSGALPLALLLVRLFAWLPAYRVLMVWVYDRTGSLLVAILMHASLAAAQLLAGTANLTSILAWATTLCVVAGAVALADRRWGESLGREALAHDDAR
jgi:membrane protease YdiL (CAAX protease family)